MNDSPEPLSENPRDRFLDAALKGLAESDSSHHEALARIEQELDQVDLESSAPTSAGTDQAKPSKKTARAWWVGLGGAAAIALTFVVV